MKDARFRLHIGARYDSKQENQNVTFSDRGRHHHRRACDRQCPLPCCTPFLPVLMAPTARPQVDNGGDGSSPATTPSPTHPFRNALLGRLLVGTGSVLTPPPSEAARLVKIRLLPPVERKMRRRAQMD